MLDKFLFDHNMSEQLARALQALDQRVDHAYDLLGKGVGDEVVIPYAAENDYALVTLDNGIRKKPELKAAYIRAGVGGFFMYQGSPTKRLDKCDLSQLMIKAWPEIKRVAARTRLPFTMFIKSRGQIVRI